MNKEKLIAARDLLTPAAAWTQTAMARKADGTKCNPDNEEAVCFCLVGALLRGVDTSWIPIKLTQKIKESTGLSLEDLFILNDKGTHESVLAFLDECIARAS